MSASPDRPRGLVELQKFIPGLRTTELDSNASCTKKSGLPVTEFKLRYNICIVRYKYLTVRFFQSPCVTTCFAAQKPSY
jgi:hypothetical protein